MIRHLFKLFFVLIIVAALAVGAGFWYLDKTWHQRLSFDDQIYTIEPGASIRRVAKQLHEKGIVPDPYSFALLGMYEKTATKIKVGDYQLNDQMTAKQLLDKFIQGDVITYKVSLVEGLTFKQFRQRIADADSLEHITTDWTDEKIMQQLGAAVTHPEGQFFPDTYVFRASDSDFDVLKQAYERMQAELNQAWQGRDNESPLKNKYEALILASIIEKETGQADERPTIGGVFTNRLNQGMLLQTDPTIIYGLGDEFDGNLRRKHLDDKSNLYNTYAHAGLPPTPIAMPGRHSLKAATNPEKTKHFYFVAKGDGSHKFSPTYKEHQRAVVKYQLKKANKG